MPPKKRKAHEPTNDAAAAKAPTKKPKSSNNNNHETTTLPGGYQELSLLQIKQGILALMDRVPTVHGDELEDALVYEWAASLQAVIEEFNLLVCLIASATYKWGSDRSGAADQNLSLLSGELQASQEQIASAVTPRLANVLAPVVDLVIDHQSVIMTTNSTENNKKKVKQNVFTQKQVDPDFMKLCRTILSRNANMLRQVCLANFYKVSQCVADYMEAQEKESNHDSRGFAY